MVSSVTVMLQLGQQVLDIPEAQSESVREPHGVADDLRRETITVVAR